jgi:hypothetical protein
MKIVINKISLLLVVGTMLLGVVGLANAQHRNDRDIRDSIRSLNSKLDDFEQDARYQMQSSSANNTEISDLMADVRTVRDRVRIFQENYDRRRENRDDVNQIVDAARHVDEFLQSNPQNRRVQDDWVSVRRQIDRLGANYGITPNWNADDNSGWVKDDHPLPGQTNFPGQNNTFTVGLSGTYDLDSARSENIEDIVSSESSLGTEQREDLREKLTAPSQIALDIRGNQVTLATSNASPVTFFADGRDKTEQSATGKTIRVRATLSGQNLIVSSLGGDTDYTITFTSLSNGSAMKVSRRITTDYLNQTVIAESIYNKTDPVAKLGIPAGGNVPDQNGGYSDNDQSGTIPNGGNTGRTPVAVTTRPGNYTVPNGVVITGILENEINTKVSQNNDRFRLTVQSPDEFRGATIQGYISNVNRSGKVSGRSNVTLNFEKITLRNGETYDFAGYLQAVVDTTGKNIPVDNESTLRGQNQSRETAKRGGIGGGVGAVIGAIAGGAKGAAIGAIIGAGGGAGTVAIQGENDIQLRQGTTVTVRSSSPANIGAR